MRKEHPEKEMEKLIMVLHECMPENSETLDKLRSIAPGQDTTLHVTLIRQNMPDFFNCLQRDLLVLKREGWLARIRNM